MALNLQRKVPCGRAWREGNSTSHGPSLQATQGRSSGSRKLGPGPLPAQASWKGKIRRKKGPRGKEVVVPRRARRWPTCPLLWNESVRGCPSAVSRRFSRHACSSHTPRAWNEDLYLSGLNSQSMSYGHTLHTGQGWSKGRTILLYSKTFKLALCLFINAHTP